MTKVDYSPFLNFCEKLFPSISPYEVQKAKETLSQFDDIHGSEGLITKPFEYLSQGDIVSQIPFIYIDDNGQECYFVAPGMLLSNTCDAQRRDMLLFAPLHKIEELKYNSTSIKDLKNNTMNQFFYLPTNKTKELVVDFGYITTLSRKTFESMLESNKTKKILSLSQIGYYLFLSKLTIYLMRRQDSETEQDRAYMI